MKDIETPLDAPPPASARQRCAQGTRARNETTSESWPEHITARTIHSRKGAIAHRFSYSVDYVLIDPRSTRGPALFSRNRANLASVQDRHHGGAPGRGKGLDWAIRVLCDAGLAEAQSIAQPDPGPDTPRIELLTQPALMGRVFNPVSFWLVWRANDLVAVIAEVSNTFGDRHSYLCRRADFAPITAKTPIEAEKIFHVSPFQEVAGQYRFTFDISATRIAIRIAYSNGEEGLIATLTGPRKPMRNRSLIKAALRRPSGALRTLVLIYWQALRLKLKGAPYRRRPNPPRQEVS